VVQPGLDAKRAFKDTSPYDNALATLLQHVGRHDDAVPILRNLQRVAAIPKARVSLLRRTAYSEFSAKRYADSERTLRELLAIEPDDPTALAWLSGLEEAKQTASYANAEAVFGALGLWIGVASPLPASAAYVMPVVAVALVVTIVNRVRRGLAEGTLA